MFPVTRWKKTKVGQSELFLILYCSTELMSDSFWGVFVASKRNNYFVLIKIIISLISKTTFDSTNGISE